MLFRRSPTKPNPFASDTTGSGNSPLPLSSPRGTARRKSGKGSDENGLVKEILLITTVLLLVAIVAVGSTLMTSTGTSSKLSTRFSPRSLMKVDADTFPWKNMKRPANASNRPSFSGQKKQVAAASESSRFIDKSSFYSELRNSYESFFPTNHRRRSLDVVKDIQEYQLDTYPVPGYDIYNCPDAPPVGYPMQWNLLNDILAQWPADDAEPPASSKIFQGLCVFDYEKDYEKAIRYRNEELPFIVKNDPAVAQTVERWNTPYYLEALLGDQKQGAEYSENSDFLYWTTMNTQHDADWKAPTQHLEMTYSEWLEKADLHDDAMLQPGMPHYYFKVVGCAAGSQSSSHTPQMPCSVLSGGEHVPYLTDELPFYTQTRSSLYIKDTVEGMQTKAINCRFGMKGVKATNHFDGERNFITVFKGTRRMILAHPNQCSKLALFPFGHPSARHSKVDWSHPDLTEFPEFEQATANEVVLEAGDSLFLPSLWHHFIVSMSLNIQCNTRSGMDLKYVKDIDACGWG
ncbi:MAG: hypothetical protein SGILL_003001 [Bacillariaceae sp.]